MYLFQMAHKKYKRQIRFVMSGAIVALVALTSLYLLTDILGFWYLFSSALSFFVAITVNFLFQQHWTFDDAERSGTASRVGMFFANALLNLFLNTVCMYALVDVLQVWYMLSQALVMVGLSIMNYLIYRYYIFKPSVTETQ
jgi:dolichol-phosphate mannosyltransferase